MARTDVLSVRTEEFLQLKEKMERGIETGFKWFSWQPKDGLLDLDCAYCIGTQAQAEDFCWDPTGRWHYHAARLLPLYQALLATGKAADNKEELPEHLTVSLLGIDRVDPLKSTRQYHFDGLWNEVNALGGNWDERLRLRLAEHMLANKGPFTLRAKTYLEKEPVFIGLHWGHNGTRHLLETLDIALLKIPPGLVVAGVDTGRLERSMAAVDWLDFPGPGMAHPDRKSIFRDMQALAANPDGRPVADLLFAKYIESHFQAVVEREQAAHPSFVHTASFVLKNHPGMTVEKATAQIARQDITPPLAIKQPNTETPNRGRKM